MSYAHSAYTEDTYGVRIRGL